MNIGVRRGDEPFEERVRLVRFALELRMKLARNKEWMILQLDNFHQFSVW